MNSDRLNELVAEPKNLMRKGDAFDHAREDSLITPPPDTLASDASPRTGANTPLRRPGYPPSASVTPRSELAA
jgi:hypothetical protein